MSKLFGLLKGEHKQNGGIFPPPVPDMEVTYTAKNGRSVIVECPEQKADSDVIAFVQKKNGGTWLMGVSDWIESNPYQNGNGLWTYLLVKA